jgi:hypothetical protein
VTTTPTTTGSGTTDTSESFPIGTVPQAVIAGMNPGYLMGSGVVQPQLAGAQGTQSNYYWGTDRPEIMSQADINQWNTAIPSSATPWGAVAPTNTPGALNINDVISNTLGLGSLASGQTSPVTYPYSTSAVAPTTQSSGSIDDLINATLGLGGLASGATTAVAPSTAG